MGDISSIPVTQLGGKGKKKTNSRNKQNQKPQQPESYSSAITGKNRLSTSVLFPSS